MPISQSYSATWWSLMSKTPFLFLGSRCWSTALVWGNMHMWKGHIQLLKLSFSSSLLPVPMQHCWVQAECPSQTQGCCCPLVPISCGVEQESSIPGTSGGKQTAVYSLSRAWEAIVEMIFWNQRDETSQIIFAVHDTGIIMGWCSTPRSARNSSNQVWLAPLR